jgi:uncharacterized membrane-anchored protein YhcB (DUF1043 family)
MKIYNIKSNKTIFDKWMKLSVKTSKKIASMFIVQNDMETNSDELNAWFKDSMEEIKKVDQDFRDIITDMLATREETVKYLKAQIEKQGENK